MRFLRGRFVLVELDHALCVGAVAGVADRSDEALKSDGPSEPAHSGPGGFNWSFQRPDYGRIDVQTGGMNEQVDWRGARCHRDCEHGGRYDRVRSRTPASFTEKRQKTFQDQEKVSLSWPSIGATTLRTATAGSTDEEWMRQPTMAQHSTETPHTEVVLMPVFVAKPECVAEFEQAMLVLQAASRADEGCIDYTAYADLDDRNRFVLYEKWTTGEALRAHNEQPHVRDFVAVVDHLLVQPFQVSRLHSIG